MIPGCGGLYGDDDVIDLLGGVDDAAGGLVASGVVVVVTVVTVPMTHCSWRATRLGQEAPAFIFWNFERVRPQFEAND